MLGQRKLWKRSVFLYELWEGNLQGGLLYRRLRKIYIRRFWRQVSLSIGAPLGTCRGRRQVKEHSGNGASLSLCRSFIWETWKEGRGSFPGDSKKHVNVTGNAASLSLRRLREGNLEGRTLCWGLREAYNRRLWKQGVSLIGVRKGNLSHLAREASTNVSIGLQPALLIFL